MWLQIVGKVRTRLSSPVNHFWSSALSVTSRGLTTSPLYYGNRALEMSLDFIDHNLSLHTTDGAVKVIGLFPRSVAEFYHELMGALSALGINVTINPMQSLVMRTMFMTHTTRSTPTASGVFSSRPTGCSRSSDPGSSGNAALSTSSGEAVTWR